MTPRSGDETPPARGGRVGPLPENAWILAATAAGHQLLAADAGERLPLDHAVRRHLAAGWWPLPGGKASLVRRHHVPRGARALVYIGDPQQEVIARVVLDEGPTLASDDRSIGIGLLRVDVLEPRVSRSRIGIRPRSGLSKIPMGRYEAAISASRGARVWRPAGVEFEPARYEVTRIVHVDASLRLVERTTQRWPTVDELGRLRFDPWERQVEVTYEGPIEQPSLDSGEQIFAVGMGGEVADVTDAALEAAWAAYEAAFGGVLDGNGAQRPGLDEG